MASVHLQNSLCGGLLRSTNTKALAKNQTQIVLNKNFQCSLSYILPVVVLFLLGNVAHAQTSSIPEQLPPIEVGETSAASPDALPEQVVGPPQQAQPKEGPQPSQESTPIEEPQPASLELLGKTLEPGKSAIFTWDLESSFSDVSAPTSVLMVNGINPGPTLCLTAAIHGDELNGIEIVRRVMYELDANKLTGAVIGVPIVNLEGFKRASRYLPDRRDLNRYFPGRLQGSYASRVAYSFFHQIVSECDYLVDIHTGSLDRTNLPQIRANLNLPAVADLASKVGSIVVLQSRGGSGTLRRAATDAGIPAVTLETGAPNNLQKEAVEKGVDTISAALRSLGFTDKRFWRGSKEPVYYRSRWVRAKQGGILFSKVALGDNVKEGTLLGLLSNPITNKTTEVRSTLEGRVIGMALNQIMYPGFAAYHIGLKSSAVEAAQPPTPVDEQELDLAQNNNSDQNTAQANIGDAEAGVATSDESAGEQDPPEVPQIEEAATIEEMELPTADESD